MFADTITRNAKIATDGIPPFVEALSIQGGNIRSTGTNGEILRRRGPTTTVIDAAGRTLIPGLNDSHTRSVRVVRKEN